MQAFSISELSQYSGIKPHTIRIWEQRYNTLQPNRSEGNTRYYDDSQLRRLLNIVTLTETGYKVSDLSALPDKKIFNLLQQNEQLPDNHFISELITAAIAYDENRFEKIFSHCLLRYGMKETYTQIIYPLLKRFGVMWSCDTMPPAKEHFVSNLIRQKLYTAIDSLPPTKNLKDTWLLFLPENEFHETGLLMAYYLIRFSGKRVIYLGANVPLSTLEAAANETAAKNILLFLVRNQNVENISAYIREITEQLPRQKVYIAANQKLNPFLKSFKKVITVQSIQSFETYL